MLAVVNEVMCENLALLVDTVQSDARVACELDAIVEVLDKPLMILSDS